MEIFEYPLIIITILILCFVILTAVGIFFAVKGAKTAKGSEEKDFVTIGKLEGIYEKSGKAKEDRCILYAKVSLDSFRSLYSAQKTNNVLAEIKSILLGFFSDDDCNIAVYEGKNFVIFSKWNMETAQKNTEAFFSELNKCLVKHGAVNGVDVKIGAYFVLGNVSLDDAICRAKQAYLLAKNQNISYAQWDITRGKALEKKIKIENSIEKEIDNNKFFLEYQPVLDAKTKKIIGAEVLSRLNSENDGILTPGSFLSAVDSVGANEKFDYYIFEKNCKWISNDKKKREPYKYTINFSRSTLSEPEFAEKIIAIAKKYDLKFSCLAVEILEDKNITGEAKKQMVDNLSALKEKGISVLLDDFGSGYTTFGDLQNLDISIVKIDKAITQNSVTDTGFIILKNIIRTASDIGFKTLCEGVETKEQEEAAIKAGTDFLQGFYYYRPMSVSQLEKVFGNEGFSEE